MSVDLTCAIKQSLARHCTLIQPAPACRTGLTVLPGSNSVFIRDSEGPGLGFLQNRTDEECKHA